MARDQSNCTQGSGWLYWPWIYGLIIGSVVASVTDQWWWVTLGVVIGALISAVARRRADPERR